jgi:hypothetical protein
MLSEGVACALHLLMPGGLVVARLLLMIITMIINMVMPVKSSSLTGAYISRLYKIMEAVDTSACCFALACFETALLSAR